ncbi:hypothetical protein E2562_027585 [Oryza meyeriana var. granulata]|nr:hypothetical protein E2562_027585 [Oryza meyeriana var. granulata]
MQAKTTTRDEHLIFSFVLVPTQRFRAHMAAGNTAAAASTACRRRLLISLIFFALFVSHGGLHASSLYFDFDFSNASTFSLAGFDTAGVAAFHGGLFDLTANAYNASLFDNVGRVSYAHPVPLWDDATGEVASFSTSFTFVINITDMNNKGDGMAFFLGQFPSTLPPLSYGGSLGLCSNYCLNASAIAGKDRFVAVEFDTFNHSFDPSRTYDHMGIDVNSVRSVANISLVSFSLNGQMSARVDYNSSTTVMSVELRFDHSPKFATATPIFNMSAKVNLTAVLPEQVAIGFSAATGKSVELHQLLSWSFSLVNPNSRSSSAGANSSKSNVGLIVALVITSAVSVILCVAVLALLSALRKKTLALAEREEESEAQSMLMDEEFQKGSGPKRFEFRQLAAATRGFSEEEKLGEGGFGSVYRGFLKELDAHVAIKKVSRASEQGRKEYSSEVKIISRLRHRNLVQLIGWCHEGRELMLVYELMPNGSLDVHLYNPVILLTRPVR